MQVDDQFQAMILRPRYSFEEVRHLPLNVRLATRYVEGPVSDGQANVVEPGGGDGCKICLRYPRVPVALEGGGGFRAVLVLTEGVLVDDATVVRIVED